MSSSIVSRLNKLEAKAPPPPSPFDGMTADELGVYLLEEYTKVLADLNASAEDRADAKRETARISLQITATVNLASGRWSMPPGFQNYQERIASFKAYWERLQPERGEYVPALNHEIESDGFPRQGRGEPAAPRLMAQRATLWQHPVVNQIVKVAPAARIEAKSLFKECASFKAGQPGKPSGACWELCKQECINARRCGFGWLVN